MKIILQHNTLQVITIEERMIDLSHCDSNWNYRIGIKLADGHKVDLSISGHKAADKWPQLDYNKSVTIQVYEPGTDTLLASNSSPIIQDDYSEEFFGCIRGEIVSRALMDENGFDGEKCTVEELRAIAQMILCYWGDSDGFVNALRFAVGEPDDENIFFGR